ncbi:MAG: host attachment protein [Rhodospirillales bacterium]
MRATRTWVVIADGARARIAVNEGAGKGLRPALRRDFAASRLPTSDLVSDRPGRYAGGGAVASHGVEPQTDRHDHEKTQLVRDVAAAIERGADRRAFDRLVLVAPPAILGKLRTALKARTRRLIAAEIGKDLTRLSLREMPQHLADAIAI